jgi:outer membrane protein
MKKLPLALAIIAVIISAISLFKTTSKTEQVYVDVNKLLEGYSRTSIVRADYEKKATLMRSNVDSLMSTWQEELKTYEKERKSMTKKELALKEELLSTKQQQISNYQQAIRKQLQEEYGKDKGYQIILGATGAGTIMYADEGTDLTPEILEKLNTSFEGK